jgi:hypothetical protein
MFKDANSTYDAPRLSSRTSSRWVQERLVAQRGKGRESFSILAVKRSRNGWRYSPKLKKTPDPLHFPAQTVPAPARATKSAIDLLSRLGATGNEWGKG